MQRKSFQVHNIKASRAERTITGIASVFGNVDAVGDVVQPGAFRKAIADFNAGRGRALFLWNHDKSQPPVAKILELSEVGRSALPAAVLAKAPEATGGLRIKRQYFKDAFSDRVYQSVIAGAVREMSFAYDVIRYSMREQNSKQIRLLEELALYDVSDVLWGANAATAAAGAKHRTFMSRRSRKSPVLSTMQQWQLEELEEFASDLVFPGEKTTRRHQELTELCERTRLQLDTISRRARRLGIRV